jgi:hypothetical protein
VCTQSRIEGKEGRETIEEEGAKNPLRVKRKWMRKYGIRISSRYDIIQQLLSSFSFSFKQVFLSSMSMAMVGSGI